MNYLGHAFLSFGHPELLTGNMIGDFVKGKKILDDYPEMIRQGILLHRKIDLFADQHFSSLKAKALFRTDYRLYAGAFVDSLYDHFLANDPRFFHSEKHLSDFAESTYAGMNAYLSYMPAAFRDMLPYMRSQNWLYNYRTLKGMQNAFNGLVRRARYLQESEKAYEILVTHYYELNQYYFDFIDDVVVYVKKELNHILPDL